MDLASSLYAFVGFMLYPAWLLGGAIDYWCHRRTDIEQTTGAAESWLHWAEYLTIVIIVALATQWRFSGWVLALAAIAALVHTALSYVDVRRTVGNRFISALEQHAHAVMLIAPAVAVTLLGLMEHAAADLERRSLDSWQRAALLMTMALAGMLILEELSRERRVINKTAS